MKEAQEEKNSKEEENDLLKSQIEQSKKDLATLNAELQKVREENVNKDFFNLKTF